MIGCIFLQILFKNNGHFIYSLDDPYIFFAMGKHHFLGVTTGITANASSSLLGVYVLAGLVSFFGLTAPLILNTIAALLNTVLFYVALTKIDSRQTTQSKFLKISLLILLIVATAQIPLIFTGMEHNIQILLCTVLFIGFIQEYQTREVSWWFTLCLIILPLWRYDCCFLFGTMTLYLLFRGHVKAAITAIFTTIFILVTYFSWWHTQGQPFFPLSIIVKSPAVNFLHYTLLKHHVSTVAFLTSTLIGMAVACSLLVLSKSVFLKYPKQIIVGTLFLIFTASLFHWVYYLKFLEAPAMLAGLILCLYMLVTEQNDTRQCVFAFILTLQIVLQVYGNGFWFAGDRDIAFYRYEAYWYVFIVLGLFTLYRESIYRQIAFKESRHITGITCAILFIFFYKVTLFPLGASISSHTIYREQYQMAMFSKNYYKKPVAVNDLGLVAYYNPGKTIDLCGLGYPGTITKTRKEHSIACSLGHITQSLKKENVNLVMAYQHWLGKVPKGFVAISKLTVKNPIDWISPVVMFYVTKKERAYTLKKLKAFSKKLPAGVKIVF